MSLVNARTLAPLFAMGATWLARKGMNAAYAKRTGHLPPAADDREVPIGKVIGWAITTAIVSATIEVVITRVAAGMSPQDEPLELPEALQPSADQQ